MSLLYRRPFPLGAALLVIATLATRAAARPPDADWKAGVASVVITPDGPIWMAGYANRTKPSEGKVHDLFAKALALEDAAGLRLVIVTMDLVGISRSLRDVVAKQAEDKYRLPSASLLLNVSHTHCGPIVWSGGSGAYELPPQEVERIERYLVGLREKLVAVIGQALADLKPAQLGYSHAHCGFAMNRRLPSAKGVQLAAYADGPVDHEVPVLRVAGADGKLRALLFGYACHNTTLSFYQICGDYAGFTQQYLEESHPGTLALFMTGCGGDQNPYPRGTLELAMQHGRALANSVEAALLPPAKTVRGPLHMALGELTIDFVPFGRDDLLKQAEATDRFQRRRAKLLLDELEKTGRLNATYPYLIHAIQFGNELTMVALAGEVVVDYSLRLSELAGSPLWIAAYSNDVYGYVPTVRVLQEGGYEAGSSMRMTRLPGPYAPSVEERIVGKVHELVRQVRTRDRP